MQKNKCLAVSVVLKKADGGGGEFIFVHTWVMFFWRRCHRFNVCGIASSLLFFFE